MFDKAFIDFDNTLYNTADFVADMEVVFVASGISRADFRSTLDLAVHGPTGQYFEYTFDRQMDLLDRLGYHVSREHLYPQLDQLFSRSYQAPDAQYFLEQLRQYASEVILLTGGSVEFQKKKLAATNLTPYFDQLVIVQEKKEEAVRERAPADRQHLFVNDDIAQNLLVHQEFPNIVVVTKKHPTRYSEEALRETGIPYFDSLTEILSYVTDNHE